MKFNYAKTIIESGDITPLFKALKGCRRNNLLNTLQDYYDGAQWAIHGVTDETLITRSGKKMWKNFDPKAKKTGFTAGELRTWNLSKAAVNIYARYARGDESDHTVIKIKQGENVSDDLSKESMALYDNVDDFIIDTTRTLSILSVYVNKYTALEFTDAGVNEPEVLKKIKLTPDGEFKAILEKIDPRQIEPLYWKGHIRGVIRFYNVDKDEAQILYGVSRKTDPLYIEIWMINDEGTVTVEKYLNTMRIEDQAELYEFLPYTLQSNEDHPFRKFDLDNIEVSDVGGLIDLQDDLNQFLTDLGLVYKNVALPLLKVTDEFLKNADDQDIEKMKTSFADVATQAGRLLFAPVEKMQASGPADSQVGYIQDLLDQYFRETSIPKSVFNSEGLANIAAETLDNLMQSLKVRVGEKRTKLETLIKSNVKKHLIHQGKWASGMEIEIHFPEMFSLGRKFFATLITEGFTNKLLPDKYATQKVLDILGDGESIDDITAQKVESDIANKAELERVLALQEVNTSVGQSTIQPVNTLEVRAQERNRDNRELETLNA